MVLSHQGPYCLLLSLNQITTFEPVSSIRYQLASVHTVQIDISLPIRAKVNLHSFKSTAIELNYFGSDPMICTAQPGSKLFTMFIVDKELNFLQISEIRLDIFIRIICYRVTGLIST